MNAVCVQIEGSRVAQSLRGAAQKLDASTPELALDLSSVTRIGPDGVQALEELAAAAGNNIKVELRAVPIDVYRVLKLMKLTERFTFAE